MLRYLFVAQVSRKESVRYHSSLYMKPLFTSYICLKSHFIQILRLLYLVCLDCYGLSVSDVKWCLHNTVTEKFKILPLIFSVWKNSDLTESEPMIFGILLQSSTNWVVKLTRSLYSPAHLFHLQVYDWLPLCLGTHLLEHYASIAEVIGLILFKSEFFFRVLLFIRKFSWLLTVRLL